MAARPRRLPSRRGRAERIAQQIDLPGAIGLITTWLTDNIAAFVAGSLRQGIVVVLTFYLLFYCLRDRAAALAMLRRYSPLSEADTERLVSRVGDTIHATIYGTLAMAIVQGTLGGLMFWWLGLPAPVLWALATDCICTPFPRSSPLSAACWCSELQA